MGFFAQNRIRIVEFNVENLFVLLDLYQGQDLDLVTEKEWRKFSSSLTPNKSLDSLRSLARTIKTLDADILCLCEIGGRESLTNFSRIFLQDAYEPFLIEGNSDRGIDIGYLVRRSLPFVADLSSHKHREIDFLYPHERLTKETGFDHLRTARLTSHRFSRDVLELRVFEATSGEAPAFIILLVHLKSQLDRNGIDPQGRDRRKAELEKLVKIRQEIFVDCQSLYGSDVPIFLAGDFNGLAAKDGTHSEFEALYRETDLLDCLEIAGVPNEERFTHMQIHNNRPSLNKQLDYIFVPGALSHRVNKLDTWVFRFQDEKGQTKIIPRNLNEKRMLPSDHYPVVLTLDPEKT